MFKSLPSKIYCPIAAKAGHKYNIIYLEKIVREAGLKNYYVKIENRKNIYYHYCIYYYGLLKSNIKGLYIYEYGYRLGIFGVTIVIRNRTIKKYGEILKGINEANKKKYEDEKCYYNKNKKLLLNEWGKSGYSWYFAKNKHNCISRIVTHGEDISPSDNITFLLGALEIIEIIEKRIIVLEKYLDKLKRNEAA